LFHLFLLGGRSRHLELRIDIIPRLGTRRIRELLGLEPVGVVQARGVDKSHLRISGALVHDRITARRTEAAAGGIAAVRFLIVETELAPDRERLGGHRQERGVPRAGRALALPALAVKRKPGLGRGFVVHRTARTPALKPDRHDSLRLTPECLFFASDSGYFKSVTLHLQVIT